MVKWVLSQLSFRSDQFCVRSVFGRADFGSGQFPGHNYAGNTFIPIGPENSIFERTILRKGQRAKKAKKIKKTKISINQNHRNSSLKRNLRKIIFVPVEKF